MQARKLRKKYLEFFESKGALRLPSSPLVTDDPTVLFTGSGMEQFKPYFLDVETPPRASVTTTQKCLRTTDIDSVGDISHCTFFEMLGNFSFGDYFKREAITWAWEFLTDVLKLDPANLRVTIYKDDEEAYRLWTQTIGLPDERVTRLDQENNYWPANAIAEKHLGPCGPDSEIFFDLQPEQPFDPDWDGEGDRWLEIWNLVFTQFTGEGEGDAHHLVPLPKRNIDTGMGLERTAAAINRLAGPFETDVLRPIIARLEELSGKTYTSSPDDPRDIAFRRVADHARATTFCLADGVTPSRTGAGYVLRRLMRRAIVAGLRTLGFERPFLEEVVPTVVEVMRDQYPELAERQPQILYQVRQEETLFRRTLDNGLARLEEMLGGTIVRDSKVLPGAMAFHLYDTYGLPIEITREITGERGVAVDEDEYRAAEETARQRSREGAEEHGAWDLSAGALAEITRTLPPTEFVGYAATETNARVVALVANGAPAESITEGQTADVLLDTTPFYAEAGGQVGDTGTLSSPSGAFTVQDTQKQGGLYFHKGVVEQGTLSVGDTVTAVVAAERRRDIMRNHTATHLLHRALRAHLGGHVQQRGSLVAPDRLRFDFAHGQALSPRALREIEAEVNDAILRELPVATDEKPIAEARELGAMMLFGEKYGDVVRVVSVGGDYSREFCGGTHLESTAQVGPFRLVSEGSAAAGVRRVEALTGRAAEAYDAAQIERLKAVASLLGVTPAQAPEAVERLQTELKAARHALQQVQRQAAGGQAETLAANAETIGGVPSVVSAVDNVEPAALSTLADDILGRLKSGVVVLGAATEGKVVLVAKASKDVVARGVHAGNVVKAAAQAAGGGGGGRPDFAQAGGRDAAKLPDALAAAREALARQTGA